MCCDTTPATAIQGVAATGIETGEWIERPMAVSALPVFATEERVLADPERPPLGQVSMPGCAAFRRAELGVGSHARWQQATAVTAFTVADRLRHSPDVTPVRNGCNGIMQRLPDLRRITAAPTCASMWKILHRLRRWLAQKDPAVYGILVPR